MKTYLEEIKPPYISSHKEKLNHPYGLHGFNKLDRDLKELEDFEQIKQGFNKTRYPYRFASILLRSIQLLKHDIVVLTGTRKAELELLIYDLKDLVSFLYDNIWYLDSIKKYRSEIYTNKSIDYANDVIEKTIYILQEVNLRPRSEKYCVSMGPYEGKMNIRDMLLYVKDSIRSILEYININIDIFETDFENRNEEIVNPDQD